MFKKNVVPQSKGIIVDKSDDVLVDNRLMTAFSIYVNLSKPERSLGQCHQLTTNLTIGRQFKIITVDKSDDIAIDSRQAYL